MATGNDDAAEYSKLDKGLDVEFAYSTSPGDAGPMADMFLMPAATIEIDETQRVGIN